MKSTRIKLSGTLLGILSRCGTHPEDAQATPRARIRRRPSTGLPARNINELKARLADGEKITALAREIDGVSRQRLWSILKTTGESERLKEPVLKTGA